MAGILIIPAIFIYLEKYFSRMHELSVAQSIIETIEKQLGTIKQLTRISLTIGPLAGISADSLQFWLSEIVKQKGFGAPDIAITKTLARAICSACKAKYEIKSLYSGCPLCESYERTIESGFEFVIDSVEVEDVDNV
jgi:hydrogenase nickel incorporation protein HypA/HybF